MAPDLADALTDHDEAAHHARALFRQGGVEAVQAAGFLVGWRGWGLHTLSGKLQSLTFHEFRWAKIWVCAEDGPPLYNTGAGIHALTIGLQGWASRKYSRGPRALVRFDVLQSAQVMGFIAGWGETWPYTNGFRCRYATVLSFHAPENVKGGGVEFVHRPKVRFVDFGHFNAMKNDESLPALTATRFVAETRKIVPCA